MGIRCADHVTPLYPQKLALTSPTGGGRSVGVVRSRTKATEFSIISVLPPVPMDGRPVVWDCGRSLAGTAGSNFAESMDGCLLWVLCSIRYRILRRADHTFRGDLSSVVCLSMIEKLG